MIAFTRAEISACTVAAFVICEYGTNTLVVVPPASVIGAFFVSQLTLLLLLIPRFWQRGVAVTYYLQNMVEPIAVVESFTSVAVVAPVAPGVPPETQAS